MKTQLIHTIARFNANPNAAKIIGVAVLLTLAVIGLALPGAAVFAYIPISGGGG